MSSTTSPTEMSRDELADKIKDLQQQNSEMKRELALVRRCFSAMLDDEAVKSLEELPEMIEEIFSEESGTGINREHLLPAHKMWLDTEAGDGNTIGDQHRRAAILFGQFEQRVVDGERTKVDASGQKFTLSSGQCKDVLSDAGEFDTIKQSGQSTVTARVMREVQRLTKVEDCDCEEIDDCDHGVVEFRPGRPHMLAAGKKRFKAAMHNAVEDLTSADDSSVDNDDEDSSRMDNKIDQLDANNTGVN